VCRLFFFLNTLEPRVEWHTKSMSLEYEPASEPLYIYVKQLWRLGVRGVPSRYGFLSWLMKGGGGGQVLV